MIGMDRVTGAPIAGADHLAQSIGDILGTPLGTRLGRRDYGALVPQMLDQPNNDLGRLRIFAAAALALMRQEGRARISRVTLSAGAEPHQAVITVTGRRTDAPGAPAFSLSSTIRALSALA
ncbi:oxidoreductase [Sphingomonas ginsenosidivorax]|uniref:Oxidoreductase n=1 Tax=Sphingomonas ginsenosidivorax TaxID=862135 RepID=A0A5C6UAE5_9SPHN|nr:GPW/gp25 family protein [Sphingomonas ginsenosidivorax]TXC69779.1 oxidoreductase [Sphingomonas ginsenosidivorax]